MMLADAGILLVLVVSWLRLERRLARVEADLRILKGRHGVCLER